MCHGVLVAAISLLFLLPYSVWGFPLTGDLRDLHLPIETLYRQALAQGRLPVWAPEIALGYPLLASAQLGFWYPPLLLLRWLPPVPVLALLIAVHSVLLGLGTYAYARSLGISRAGATLTATAFTGSGFVIGHLLHLNIFFGVAWLPLALLAVERLATSLRPRFLLLGAASFGLLGLAGHFQILTLALLLAGARFLVVLRDQHRGTSWTHTLWTAALLFTPVVALTVLLTAAQLLPTLELLRESTRGGASGFDVARANQHSFPPWHLLTFLLPAFFGFPDLSEYWGTRPQIEMTAWIGAIPLLLALVGATTAMTKSQIPMTNRERKWSLVLGRWSFWPIAALVGFLLALGKWSPFRLIGIEPTLGIFSGPARWLLVTQVALALLAGVGLDRLRAARHQAWSTPVGLVGLLAILLILGSSVLLRTQPDLFHAAGNRVVERFIVGQPEHVLPQEAYAAKVDYLVERLGTWGVNAGNPRVLVSVVALAAGSVMLLRHQFRLRVVFALTIVELTIVAWSVHPTTPWKEARLASPLVAALRDRPAGRVMIVHPPGDTGLLFANQTTTDRREHDRLLRDLTGPLQHAALGLPGTDWPAALDLAEVATVLAAARDDLGRPEDHQLLDRLGIRYVAGSSATPDLALPPPARGIAEFPSGESRTITLWERPTARPRAELFGTRLAQITDNLPTSVGTAEILQDIGHRVRVRVENPLAHDAALVLRDTWFPGWTVSVDNRPAPLERAETIFRAVSVPPGTHLVELFYPARLAGIGMLVSGFAWAATLAGLWRPIQRRPPP